MITVKKTYSSLLTCCALYLVSNSIAHAGFETKKLELLLSASETKGNDESIWTYGWNFDGKWQRSTLNIKVDSDFSRSDVAKLDRLRTGFRLMSKHYGKIEHKWYPLLLIETEGDHSGESIYTLVSYGYRQKRRYGNLELTFGTSKDIRTSEAWVGDVGGRFLFEKNFGRRWRFKTGPQASLGALGEVRLRDDRVRYSWDANLDYQASKNLGIGYRLWTGNTVPNSGRTQWIGITYKKK